MREETIVPADRPQRLQPGVQTQDLTGGSDPDNPITESATQ